MTDTTHTEDAQPESIWIRGMLMFVFLILFGLAETLLCAMTVIQFLWTAITGKPNVALVDFGDAMAEWLSQVARFQTMKSDDRPFPWGDWPKGT